MMSKMKAFGSQNVKPLFDWDDELMVLLTLSSRLAMQHTELDSGPF